MGIVAVSAEGAALCDRTIAAEGRAAFGRHGHPRMTMDTIPLRVYMARIDRGAWDGVATLLRESATVPEQAGAVALACTELPLAVEGAGIRVPTLDSTRILARAALRHTADRTDGEQAAPRPAGTHDP